MNTLFIPLLILYLVLLALYVHGRLTLLEHQKQKLNREIDAWKERARALAEEASRNERKANEAEAAVHRLYYAVKELQVVSVAIPDKNVKVRLPWDDRETRVGDIFDRACASVAIARSIMFPGAKPNSFGEILANMPSVLQQ